MEETKDINETAEEKNADKKKKTSKNAELEALKAEIETLKAEIKEKDDKYLRLAAEYDNFRRRSREEKDATYSTAMADTVCKETGAEKMLLHSCHNLTKEDFEAGKTYVDIMKDNAEVLREALGK